MKLRLEKDSEYEGLELAKAVFRAEAVDILLVATVVVVVTGSDVAGKAFRDDSDGRAGEAGAGGSEQTLVGVLEAEANASSLCVESSESLSLTWSVMLKVRCERDRFLANRTRRLLAALFTVVDVDWQHAE